MANPTVHMSHVYCSVSPGYTRQQRITSSSLVANGIPCNRFRLGNLEMHGTMRMRPERSLSFGNLGLKNFERTNNRLVMMAGEVNVSVEDDTKDRMEKSLESVQRNFATVRTGRANPSLLDRIEVDYWGTMTPLNQMSTISAPEASLLVIQPFDASSIPEIEKAIQLSDVGLTPNNDGKLIRLQIPQLTADRRKEMTKIVSKMGEEGKVAIRNVRRDAMKALEKLEKDGEMSEDEKKGLESSIQKLTDDCVKKIDAMVKSKTEELTKV